MALRYTTNSVVGYAKIKTITSGLITVQGLPLDTGAGTLTALAWGSATRCVQVDMFVAGAYGDGTITTLFETDMKSRFIWRMQDAFMVYFAGRHNTNAGTTQPSCNMLCNTARVSSVANGISLSTTVVENGDVAINGTNYKISPGQTVEIEVTVAGNPTTGASDLTMTAFFVLE
jgi:hypothetical protein